MMTKKAASIVFIISIVVILIMFFGNTKDLINTNSSIKELKSELAKKDNAESTDEELNVPIENKEEIINNVGAREELLNPSKDYEFEIINLEDLSKVISTNGNELLEIYSGTRVLIQNKLSKDTYSYIDPSSMSKDGNYVKFSLYDSDSRKLIEEVKVKYQESKTVTEKIDVASVIVTNLEVLEKYFPGERDRMLYVYNSISSTLKNDFNRKITCYVDTKTIVKSESKIRFTLNDETTKKPLKTITLKL